MLDSLLYTPGLIPGIAIGVLIGAAAVFLLLLAFEALEERGTRTDHTPPRPMPTPAWGDAPHGRSARADLRSKPR